MTKRRRTRHIPEEMVKKLRDADTMLSAGKDPGVVLQALEIAEVTYHRWRNQYGGMKSSEAKRLKELEVKNRKLKEIVAEQQVGMLIEFRPCFRLSGWSNDSGLVNGALDCFRSN